ncbi:MAG: YdeI/OmpD-associated family protein [Flavisolibacter sp.]
MIKFTATIKRFDKQGEKTGWTYIDVPSELAKKLCDNKKGFRIKGKLDHYAFEQIALLPMGGGDFIMTLNATIRKAIRKLKGAKVEVVMEVDHNEIKPIPELIECLKDEPAALERFNSLPKSHQNYYSNWVKTAKTEPTKAKRIAAVVNAMEKHMDFGQMIRAMRQAASF